MYTSRNLLVVNRMSLSRYDYDTITLICPSVTYTCKKSQIFACVMHTLSNISRLFLGNLLLLNNKSFFYVTQ